MRECEESMQYFIDKNFYQFEELDLCSQKIAMIEVSKTEKNAHLKRLKEAKEQYNLNPNRAINDDYHIKRIINGAQAFYKIIRLGDSYLIKLIQSNMIWFNKDGSMADIFK